MAFVGVIVMDLVRVVEVRYAEVRKKFWVALLDMFGFGDRIRILCSCHQSHVGKQ